METIVKPTRIPAAQESYLLRFSMGARGGKPATARALFARGLLGTDARGNAVVTPTGRAYLDAHHTVIA